MAQRTFRTLLIAATVITIVIATGCARSSTRTGSAATAPAASPSSAMTDLVGTWRGTAWDVSGTLASARTDATLQINDDQTWSAQWRTNQGAEQRASGTLTTSGDRVVLRSDRGGTASLVHRGDTLYGLLNSAVAGFDVQLDLKKAH